MRNKIFAFLLLVLFFSACGKKGPLVLEPENPLPAVESFQIRQVGGQIELSWKFPRLLADKEEVFDVGAVTRIHIYHDGLKTEEAPGAEIFFKKAGLLAKPKAAEIKGLRQNSPSFRLAFKNKELQGKFHGLALVYFYGRKKSHASPLRTLRTQIPPPPIQDLNVSRQGKMVILNWSQPAFQDKEPAARPISGYQVYRRIISGSGEFDFRPVGAGRTANEFFHDLDTGADGEYEYQVASCLDERVESEPSNTARIRVVDTFAPDIPGNLVLFTAKDQIFLTWESVPDKDLDFYRLYRRSSEKEDFQVLADKITDNFFRDKQVARGKLYIYAISAVDKKGNESEFSGPVQQLFE
jgi:hypothetical protein